MTKEELEKEAYKEAEKIKEYQTEPNNEYEKGFNNGEVRGYKDGYRDGAEPREKRIAELERQLEISETNADTYYDELTKLQEQLVKSTQIGMTCSNCKWSQYDEDEMCYCCSNKDKWELKLRR